MKSFFITPLVVFLMIVSCFSIQAQTEKKPKIAVVLSGGGAKGITHISLLQTLDSLGIVPDLIVGASMGSLVGGFYAMGYSGDSIAEITLNLDWDKLLGGKTLLKDVGVEEKSEFNRYLLPLNIENRQLKSNSAIINDQYLREFFAKLTYPAYTINKFDDLAIPYRALATDILTGEEVILKDGSLALAMRASMSIPSVFQPVEYKDAILVDGGIVNNFPVNIAKAWGADIIIGSDCAGGMKSREELEGLSGILFQTTMLISNIRNEESQAMCDILLDHSSNLAYSTGDFKKAAEIYEQGKIATASNLDKLVDLAKTLEPYKQKTVELPSVTNKIVLDTIIYNGISEDNLELLKARMDVKTNTVYTIDELEHAVERAMGTNLFSQVDAIPVLEEGLVGMRVSAIENPPHQLRFALHFDDNSGIGLLGNYIGRNVLGKSSRILVSGDISNDPSYRIQYQKQFGKNKSWWIRNELFQNWATQKFDVFGIELNDEFLLRYSILSNEINKNIKPLESYIGFGVDLYNHRMTPKVDPAVDLNAQNIERFEVQSTELYVHYSKNNLNKVFFPTKGSKMNIRLARTLLNKSDFITYNPDEIEDPAFVGYENITVGNFTRILFQYEKRVTVNPKVTWIINPEFGFMFADNRNSSSNYDKAAGFEYHFGGSLPNFKRYYFSSYGLTRNQINAYQFIHLGTSLQISPVAKFFITPHIDYFSASRGYFDDYIENALLPKHKWVEEDISAASYLYSIGSTFSYNSIIGPVNIDITSVGGTGNNQLKFYVGLGLFIPI